MYTVDQLFNAPVKSSTFISAEIGINHQGNADYAKELIESAKASGADAVKFQIFKADYFYNPLLSPEGHSLFKSFELRYEDFRELKNFSDSLDILFYATPFDFESLDFLIDLKCPVIKVASSDITNEPFLKRIAEKAKKYGFAVIISTGFAGMKEIKDAAGIFQNCHLSILYCVSKYPAESIDIDLNFIKTLQDNFYVPVGFSDHSEDMYLSIGAVSLGAKLIERHFTTDNSKKGADHAVSLNPVKFSEMVRGIRTVEESLGRGVKNVTSFERDISYSSMRSIYAARRIKKGELIEEKDILLLRPGKGVSNKHYRSIAGKKAKRDIEKYEEV
jgi:sialic acid synthase SpsE